jgi:hypothetical protein
MEFQDRLKQAIDRGHRLRARRDQEAARRELTLEERRELHSHARLDLSDRIEERLRQLAENFPGFQYETLFGDEGWGARITRDDLRFDPRRQSESLYSRLELVVTPLASTPIIEVLAKGTVRNKEVFHRKHYQQLELLDPAALEQIVDSWVVEYAELFAATG